MVRQAWQWIKASPARLTIFVVAMVLLVVALIPTVITWAPHWLASTSGLNADQSAAEVGRVRTALLAILAGGIALVGATYTARTFALNRQGQITERFTRAVEQLGSDQLDVRLGGIYALERLARESPGDHSSIVEILTAYVRGHAQLRLDAPDEDTRPEIDIQAVLTVLGRRTVARDNPRAPLDLERTFLSGADLENAPLESVRLERANLDHARLREAKLEYAQLARASLARADLQYANLDYANLIEADLQGATLLDADLRYAHLRGAVLRHANLQGAHLEGAHLHGADLEGANLHGAHFFGPGPEPEFGLPAQAHYDSKTRWPVGFDPEDEGVATDMWDEGG